MRELAGGSSVEEGGAGDAVRRQVDARLTQLLYRNAALGQVVNLLVASLLAILGARSAPGRAMFAWLAVTAVCALARWRLAHRYGARAVDEAEAPLWRRRYFHATAALSLAWTAGAVLILWHNDETSRTLGLLVAAGMVAGAVPLLGAVPAIFRVFAVPISAGVALASLVESPDALHLMVAAFVLVFLMGVLRSANFLHQTIVDAFELQIEKDRVLQRLEQSRQAAESASLAKTQFLATVSHELRTPLTGILGMAELLLQPGVAEDERREYAQIVFNSGKSLLRLLNDILDLSKVEAGRMELSFASFEPAVLLDELATLFREPLRRKGVAIEARWEGAPGARYRSDPLRVRQMLTNLLANAVKFTDHGSVRIEARELPGALGGPALEFAVEDTGVGIAPQQLERLFQPFSQLDNAHTRRAGGTGLGLSIVRRIAQLMGGEVGVDSTPGRGSRFWVRIAAAPLQPRPAA